MAGQKRTDNKGRKLPDGFSQRSDGRYQARWTFEGKRYCMYDQDLAVLKKKVMQYKVDLENGNLRIIEKVTLNQWFDKWMLAYKKDKIKPLTYANYEKYWNRYIRDTIGKMEMSKIKRIHVIELYNSFLNKEVKPLSIGTITYVNNLVYSSLEQAVRNDVLMSKNPADGVMKELTRTSKKEKRALTVQEQEIFFSFLNTNQTYNIYKPMFTVLFGTGLRIGELLALTWDDINYADNIISINKTLHYQKLNETDKQHFAIGSPKSVNSIRTIPMLPEVRKALHQQKQYQLQIGVSRDFIIDEYSGFIFTTKKGSTFNMDSVNSIIKRIIKACNEEEAEKASKENREPILIRPFSPHAARHTFATRCFENEMQPKTVQEILGHSAVSITMDIYTHVTKDMAQKEINLLKGIKIS